MNDTERGPASARRIRHPISHVLIAAAVTFGIGGCGGGGGSGAGGNEAATGAGGNGSAIGSTTGTGTVSVAVTNALGEPARGISVRLDLVRNSVQTSLGEVLTDADGQASFIDVPAAQVHAHAYGESPVYSFGESSEVTLQEGQRVDLAITIQPGADYETVGVAATRVEANAVAADGRSLEFSLRVIPLSGGGSIGGGYDLTLSSCTPDPANDAPGFQADCIKGPAGFDAPYEVAGGEVPLPFAPAPGGSPESFSAALLIDQSRNITVNDPLDARLFLAKYFLTGLRTTDRVVVAAYATNDTVTGGLSLLPQQPATVFPVENPQFTPSSSALFPTLDSLASLEGGAAPLYAAIDRMLDFTAQAPGSRRRAVVVLTDGQDDTCGSPAECLDAQQALIAKSRAANVAIVTIGVASATGRADRRVLSELAEGSGGVALWADQDPHHLGIVFGSLGKVLDSSAPIRTARVRLVSATGGAFQSGRTVLGTLHVEVCPWLCAEYDMPIAVRIP